jgi:hypothetical protein
MIKQAQPKPVHPTSEKTTIFVHGRDGKIMAFLARADDVVERTVTKALASSTVRKSLNVKVRTGRTPQISIVERQLSELKKVVKALAVRSVAQERSEHSYDEEGILVLDAKTAYRLLDNPPEPTDTLRSILALR